MKDIVLFDSAAARGRREKHSRTLEAMHKSDQAPPELTATPPRKLRLKPILRLLLVLNITLLLIALCGGIYFCVLMGRIINELSSDLPQGEQRVRQRAAQAVDPEQRQRAEQTLHRYEILNRQLRRLQILVLVTVAVGMIGVPIVHVAVNWFVHIRPELVLLREGVPVRATVTAVTRCLGFISRIEYGFTAAHGESVRKKQFVATAESSVFKIGDSLWVLSLPDRPKHAQLYGLYHQFAELTMGD